MGGKLIKNYKYSDLTQEEKDYISNGCGGSKYFRPPELEVFLASCSQHDYYYWQGGLIWHKTWADLQFLWYMFKDSFSVELKWYQSVFFTLLAIIYFLGVTAFGVFFYRWGFRKISNEEILDKVKKKKQENKE